MTASLLPFSTLVLLLLSCLLPDTDALVMPQVFGTHMVLQRAPLRAKLWGEAQPHTTVTCTVDEEAGMEVVADGAGRFVCELKAYQLSWNRTVTVSGDKQTILFEDVAFGDVILCLGSDQPSITGRTADSHTPLSTADHLHCTYVCPLCAVNRTWS